MLPLLKMLEMIPDTNGIHQALAKQCRGLEGAMEKGDGRQSAFLDILADQTSLDKTEFKGLALGLLKQRAGLTMGDHGLARHLRQLLANFTAQNRQGELSPEDGNAGEEDGPHQWDEVAWCDVLFSMIDSQAVGTNSDPNAPNALLNEVPVDEDLILFEKGDQAVAQLAAANGSQSAALNSSQVVDAKAVISGQAETTGKAVLHQFASLVDGADPADAKDSDAAANQSLSKNIPSELQDSKSSLSGSDFLGDQGLKQAGTVVQPKDNHAAANLSTAPSAKPSLSGLTNAATGQVQQSSGMDEKTIDKGIEPKSEATATRSIHQDPASPLENNHGDTGQGDQGDQGDRGDKGAKEAKGPIQAEHRFKNMFKASEKMDASINQAEDAPDRRSTVQTATMQNSTDQQRQPSLVQSSMQTNSTGAGDKHQLDGLTTNHDDTTTETVSPKTMTDHGERTISKAGESETAPGAKEERADVIRQIVQRMTLRHMGSQSQMTIRLKPEILGQLRMQIISDNNQLAVRMTAESAAVKDLIEQNLHQLKSELNVHGLDIQKIDVAVQNNSQDPRQGQDLNGFGQFARRNEQDRKRRQHRQSVFGHKDEALNPVKSLDGRSLKMNSSEVDYFV